MWKENGQGSMDFWEISDEKLTIFIVELRTDHIHYLWVFSSCGKQQNFDPETSKKLRSN
jgi:hypothetical protein